MSFSNRFVVSSLLAAALWSFMLPDTAHSAECTVCTPVTEVPQERWGTLQPAGILGDNTAYRFNYEPDCNEPFWFNLDTEGGSPVRRHR